MKITSAATVCVVGAGQLGSRHLQSLAALAERCTLHAVDPSPDAQALARARMGSAGDVLQFHKSSRELPRTIDVAIVATGARERRKTLEDLYSHCDVAFLILEKVLFQSVADCLWARDFLLCRQTRAWVNFPRRVQPAYEHIQKAILPGQRLEIRVTGSRWGLATSAVHFLDLVLFLTGHSTVTINRFEGQRFPSVRHADCVECTGYLEGEGAPGQVYSITAWPDGSAPLRVTIDAPECRWIVDEQGNQTITSETSVARGWRTDSLTHPFLYQSQLTALIVEHLLTAGCCELSDYETALQSHIPFLRCWNRYFAPDADPDITVCKIT